MESLVSSRSKPLDCNYNHEGGVNEEDSDDADVDQRTEKILEELKRDSRKDLAFKAGFVSLQERLSTWTRQASVSPHIDAQDRSLLTTASDEQHKQKQQQQQQQQQQQILNHAPQFATLHEFFQSKSSLRKQLEQDELLRLQKRPKMPIMKLTKDDWNVKCWEERFSKSRGPASLRTSCGARTSMRENSNENSNKSLSSSSSSAAHAGAVQPNRASKLGRQIEVFNGRISEVAKKLDKVREGAPMDEQLYKLKGNKMRQVKREHVWTDLLKNELSEGVHNPKILKSKLQTKLSDSAAATTTTTRISNSTTTSADTNTIRDIGDESVSNITTAAAAAATTTTTATHSKARLYRDMKSPLGRPIGRISDDDDDDDDDGRNEMTDE